MSLNQRIAAAKVELDGLRPLSVLSLAELDRWYEVELTYTSNALEGNTLTRNETAIILEKGITVSGKPLRDHLERERPRSLPTATAPRSKPAPGSF